MRKNVKYNLQAEVTYQNYFMKYVNFIINFRYLFYDLIVIIHFQHDTRDIRVVAVCWHGQW